MKTFPIFLLILMLLWITTTAQQSLIGQYSILGFPVDYVLSVSIAICMLTDSNISVWIGFLAGLIYGGSAGVNVSHYIIGFSFALFALSFTKKLEIELRIFPLLIFSFFASVFAKIILLFLAPPGSIFPYLYKIFGTSLYNGLFATLVYFLLRPFLKTKAVW